MYKISELIGKQSITLMDADSHGVVAGAYFDRMLTKCRYFLLLSDEDENRYFVDYKNLASLSQDAMVIKSSASITEQPSGDIVPSPINLPAYNQDGKSLGVIRDIIMDDASVSAFVTDEGQIEAGTMLSRSDTIVVFNDTGKPLKIKKTAKKGESNNNNHGYNGDIGGISSVGSFMGFDASIAARSGYSNSVRSKQKAQNIANTAQNAAQNQDEKQAMVETPFKVSPYENALSPDVALSKYYFLLGKRLQRSIYGKSGTVIARENDLITEDVIQTAKDSGKLVAIALHSL